MDYIGPHLVENRAASHGVPIIIRKQPARAISVPEANMVTKRSTSLRSSAFCSVRGISVCKRRPL